MKMIPIIAATLLAVCSTTALAHSGYNADVNRASFDNEWNINRSETVWFDYTGIDRYQGIGDGNPDLYTYTEELLNDPWRNLYRSAEYTRANSHSLGLFEPMY